MTETERPQETAGGEEATSAKEEAASAFDPSNILPAILITLTRLYDVNMALLKTQNPLMADTIRRKHANGEVLASPPSIRIEEE